MKDRNNRLEYFEMYQILESIDSSLYLAQFNRFFHQILKENQNVYIWLENNSDYGKFNAQTIKEISTTLELNCLSCLSFDYYRLKKLSELIISKFRHRISVEDKQTIQKVLLSFITLITSDLDFFVTPSIIIANVPGIYEVRMEQSKYRVYDKNKNCIAEYKRKTKEIAYLIRVSEKAKRSKKLKRIPLTYIEIQEIFENTKYYDGKFKGRAAKNLNIQGQLKELKILRDNAHKVKFFKDKIKLCEIKSSGEPQAAIYFEIA